MRRLPKSEPNKILVLESSQLGLLLQIPYKQDVCYQRLHRWDLGLQGPYGQNSIARARTKRISIARANAEKRILLLEPVRAKPLLSVTVENTMLELIMIKMSTTHEINNSLEAMWKGLYQPED